MCGIFGYTARRSGQLNLDTLKRIALNTQSRGPHAFGFAWVDGKGRLHRYKMSGRIGDHLAVLAMARDARMLIGHCRYATHGDPGDNLNNHPHPVDGGWLVHNGVLHAYEDLVNDHNLWPVSQCDSEVLGLLIERQDGPLLKRCQAAVEVALGDDGGPFAMLALWHRPARMVVVRRGNPLSWSNVAEGYYWASLPDALPGKAQSLQDGTVGLFTQRDAKYARLAEPARGGLFR